MVPAPLRHSSVDLLEWGPLRAIVSGYAQSELAGARIAALAPTADRTWIEQQHQLTAEVRAFLRTGGAFSFSGLKDPGAGLDRARIEGASLELAEIRQILQLVDCASAWREVVLHPPSSLEWPEVAKLARAVIAFAPLQKYFKGKILPEGTLDDRASPALARLRREVEKQKRLIQSTLEARLRRLSESSIVQDELITVRGERFVIPVRTEQKRKVQGVVHGASSSGQTVFIEPMETIEQNNELVRLIEEEQAEVRRILLEMTQRIAAEAGAIAAAADVLAEIETQFAKARFADDYGCVAPEMASAVLHLSRARHPVLERNLRARNAKVVPLALEMGEGSRQLVISGPNTGGKTVALKTIGLLALMAQAGIPVPADKAVLPVFDAVLADIGDYQSLEQNLSTFSAHVTNINAIAQAATADSLVLLDELGSATDPEEGAALAVAIAGFFLERGAFSVISTHHTALKVYAANTQGVLNAAVGFEEKALRPTYELRLGVPGASAGINIAARLGLNASIIQNARSRLGAQAHDVAAFLDRLHCELAELEAQQAKLAAREREVERERQRLDAEGVREQRALVKELEKKLEGVLRDFEFRLRETVQSLEDRAAAQKLTREGERRLARLRSEFKEQFDAALVAHNTGADAGDPDARPSEVRHVGVGDTVHLKSLGRSGVVKRVLASDIYEVEVGKLKMKVAKSDIAQVQREEAVRSPVEAARARGISVQVSDDAGTPGELNVIGETVDEATRRVEKFLDRAFLAGLPRVRIVHGSGMGVLRKALRQYLRQHPQVATVSEPPQNEGGAGATVVELQQ